MDSDILQDIIDLTTIMNISPLHSTIVSNLSHRKSKQLSTYIQALQSLKNDSLIFVTFSFYVIPFFCAWANLKQIINKVFLGLGQHRRDFA
jgi:hypothetical protein